MECTFVHRCILEWSGTIFVVFVPLHSVMWSGVERASLRRYVRKWSGTKSHGRFVAVFMCQAAAAAGAKLINPLPEVAGAH